MTTKTTESLNIYQKLMNIRKDFHDLELKKSGRNKFANYDYFELKDFIPQTVKLLHKHGAVAIFNLHDESATLTLYNTENQAENIVFNTPIADASGKGQLPIQSLGSQHTYLRRYLYLNLLDIVESDGIDSLPDDKKDDKPTSCATDKQIGMIKSLYNQEELTTMLERLNKPIEQLTVQEASKMIKVRSKK